MLFAASTARAESNPNPGVHPPGSKPYGVSYSGWAADWAEWGLSIPTAENPFLDPDGRFCQVDQLPPVFFLGNNFGGATVRHCNVPPGQSILFSPAGSLCVLHIDADTEEECRAGIEEVLQLITNVAADVDGQPLQDLQSYRVMSGLFSLTLPPDNIFGLPPGQYQAVSGGYFVMHTPLSAGQHVIHFHDEVPEFGAIFDVTYLLTVGAQH
jgi:hypothetical protein